ncbi:hypothetical protein [Prevotella pallens]|nr:hypothetical protein [Prevotella pallens]MBF1472836.1 hypothetical protein [Prevotella pallens]
MMYCNAILWVFRGRGMMYCNINGGNTQRHFVELRGYGHDKSAPTPTG